jgi:hypothetical protein
MFFNPLPEHLVLKVLARTTDDLLTPIKELVDDPFSLKFRTEQIRSTPIARATL